MRELEADIDAGTDVPARTALARLLRAAAQVSAVDWIMMDAEVREEVHDRGALVLVAAAGVTEAEFAAMAPFSPERAEALLRGALLLDIETDWRGWE